MIFHLTISNLSGAQPFHEWKGYADNEDEALDKAAQSLGYANMRDLQVSNPDSIPVVVSAVTA